MSGKKSWNYKLGLDYSFNLGRNYFKKTPLKSYPINKTKRFHRKKSDIPRIIRGTIGNREVVYGEHALKVRFPTFLERPTQDYDVYSPNPLHDAKQAERALDRHFGGDYFYVKQAQHQGTWKVIAHANEEGYADFSPKPQNITYDKIRGVNYVKLQVEKQNRMKSLKDPDFAWRHGKDRDALNRIKLYERMGRR